MVNPKPILMIILLSMMIATVVCKVPIPLGLEDNIIPDSSLEASSEWDQYFGPERARLNLARVGNLRGAWSARINDANQWIQVDLLDTYRIVAVATQGRQDLDQWVTSYRLACSINGTTFDTIKICSNLDRIFTGNSDRNTIVTNNLPDCRKCRYVRLMPFTWQGHISLRMEIYGEGPLKVIPLGVESNIIPDSNMEASSKISSYHGPRRARLNLVGVRRFSGGWVAGVNDANQWIQVNLFDTYRIISVGTQGRQDSYQMVTRYKLACSTDGTNFYTIQGSDASDKIFTGNCDRNTIVTNALPEPQNCSYVRLMPVTWYRHISLRMEVYGEGPLKVFPLGIENNTIPDSSLEASSEYDANHAANRARLNLAKVGDLRGAWSARVNDANQWIQVDLLDTFHIVSVGTQGREDALQWVISYKFACSTDGTNFSIIQSESLSDKIFTGNFDRNTVVTNALPEPQNCRYVRLIPVSWYRCISLRMELYGKRPVPPVMARPLGLESEVIPDSRLTASGQFNADRGPGRARLNLDGAWSARISNTNQWIQVDLLVIYSIVSVATQGRPDSDEWVTSYKLSCSIDDTVEIIQDSSTSSDKVFTGNSDPDTVVKNDLPEPQNCRYVRLMPYEWNARISLRMEIYGEGPLTGWKCKTLDPTLIL